MSNVLVTGDIPDRSELGAFITIGGPFTDAGIKVSIAIAKPTGPGTAETVATATVYLHELLPALRAMAKLA